MNDDRHVRMTYDSTQGRHSKTLRSEWIEFARLVVPANAPPVQHQCMQDAFYAGATIMLALITHQTDDGVDASQADLDYLSRLHAEITAYSDSVKRR